MGSSSDHKVNDIDEPEGDLENKYNQDNVVASAPADVNSAGDDFEFKGEDQDNVFGIKGNNDIRSSGEGVNEGGAGSSGRDENQINH